MKMKKLFGFILAIGILCSVAACGGNGGNNPNGSSVSSSEEELPLGAEGNPHKCYYELDYDTGEIIGTSMKVPAIKANSAEYYLISKSGDKVVCIEQADVTVVYKGTSYSAKDGMIDYVESESKNGLVYCVSLKSKGTLFKKDQQKQRRHASWLILRTALLAIFSFAIGLLLRAIFD